MTRAAIERVDLQLLSFPLPTPFRAAIRTIPTVDYVLARVRTAGGLEGVGYAFAFGRDEAAVLAACARLAGDRALGLDALATDATWDALHRSLALLGATGPAIVGLAAIDIALWDIKAKAAALPLWRLLGAARESIPIYGSGGSLDQSPARLAEEMAGYAASTGCRAVKLKLGHGRDGDHARLAEVRREVGPDLRLIVDGNQQWSVGDAIAAARDLAAFGIWWLEEPVAASDIAGCAAVRAAAAIEIATGETNFTLAETTRLIEARAADILMPNLARLGGITPWLRFAAAAHAAGMPVASHVYPEINVHLMCAVPNALILEHVPWWPRLSRSSLAIRDGVATPPTAPGLGIELDVDVLARHAMS